MFSPVGSKGRQAGRSSVIFYLNLFTQGLLGKGVSCSEGGSFVGNHFTNPHRSVHLRGSHVYLSWQPRLTITYILLIFKIYLFIFILCVWGFCLQVCQWTVCALCWQKPQEGSDPLELYLWTPSCLMVLGTDPGPPQEQQFLLTTELFLCPPPILIKVYIVL